MARRRSHAPWPCTRSRVYSSLQRYSALELSAAPLTYTRNTNAGPIHLDAAVWSCMRRPWQSWTIGPSLGPRPRIFGSMIRFYDRDEKQVAPQCFHQIELKFMACASPLSRVHCVAPQVHRRAILFLLCTAGACYVACGMLLVHICPHAAQTTLWHALVPQISHAGLKTL